jgi:hypothetical protein
MCPRLPNAKTRCTHTLTGKRTGLRVEEHSRGCTLGTWFDLIRRAIGVGERNYRGGLSYKCVFRRHGGVGKSTRIKWPTWPGTDTFVMPQGT